MKKFLKWIALAMATLSLSAMFAACAPSSVDKGRAKMAEAGYTVTDVVYAGYDGCLGGFFATEGAFSGDHLTAYLFESTDAAKAYMEKHGKQDTVLKGKWVITGSEDAIEDFMR